MRKIIALSSLLALGALGMACGDAANTNTGANKANNAVMNTVSNMNAMASNMNAMASNANAMASNANAMASNMNKMENKMVDNGKMANANPMNANK